MTFEELREKVEQLKIIPDAGIKQIPAVLSVRTKKKLYNRPPEETASIIMNAIDQINLGSIATLDSLVWKQLE